jgi:hypothetical protein
MRVILLVVSVICSSCLGGVSSDDMGVPDMASDVDLYGVDLAGRYNCLQLNQCTSNCKNLMCVAACREKATPIALAKEADLQSCLNTWCPQTSDMANPICALDANGERSASCKRCVENTQKATSSACTPPGAPECQKCFGQAKICLDDL